MLKVSSEISQTYSEHTNSLMYGKLQFQFNHCNTILFCFCCIKYELFQVLRINVRMFDYLNDEKLRADFIFTIWTDNTPFPRLLFSKSVLVSMKFPMTTKSQGYSNII